MGNLYWVSRFDAGYYRQHPVEEDGVCVSVTRRRAWELCCEAYGINPYDAPRLVNRSDGSMIYLHFTFTPRKN